MSDISFFNPVIVTDLAELLLIIACFFAIRIKLIRIAAILILIATVIDLASNWLVEPEVRQFLVAKLSVQDADAFIANLRLAVASISESFNIFGVAALLVVIVRHKRHCAASISQ